MQEGPKFKKTQKPAELTVTFINSCNSYIISYNSCLIYVSKKLSSIWVNWNVYLWLQSICHDIELLVTPERCWFEAEPVIQVIYIWEDLKNMNFMNLRYVDFFHLIMISRCHTVNLYHPCTIYPVEGEWEYFFCPFPKRCAKFEKGSWDQVWVIEDSWGWSWFWKNGHLSTIQKY